MLVSLRWLLIISLTSVNAQEPRKKNSNDLLLYENPLQLENNDEDISCTFKTCFKRSPGQDYFGPFWANRGKKDPTYSKLYAEEPHWIVIRQDDKDNGENEPFYVRRGKKYTSDAKDDDHFWKTFPEINLRNKRNYIQHLDDTPFFAARGRRHYN